MGIISPYGTGPSPVYAGSGLCLDTIFSECVRFSRLYKLVVFRWLAFQLCF